MAAAKNKKTGNKKTRALVYPKVGNYEKHFHFF